MQVSGSVRNAIMRNTDSIERVDTKTYSSKKIATAAESAFDWISFDAVDMRLNCHITKELHRPERWPSPGTSEKATTAKTRFRVLRVHGIVIGPFVQMYDLPFFSFDEDSIDA